MSLINKAYKEVFTENSILTRITEGLLLMFSEVFTFISCFYLALKYLDEYLDIKLNFIIRIGIGILLFIVSHYLIGYLILITSKIKRGEESIKVDFLFSYFLTSAYLSFIIIFPEEIYKYVISGAIGVCTCYFINLKILINFMKNPSCVRFSMDRRGEISKIMISAILIVMMIILNLYLGVCITNSIGAGGFSNNPTNFDLFYYTIVTFTTIGFGDIIPITFLTKFIAIIISITSIICLTIFLGNIYSYFNEKVAKKKI